jgi:hypothetical protein
MCENYAIEETESLTEEKFMYSPIMHFGNFHDIHLTNKIVGFTQKSNLRLTELLLAYVYISYSY